jgi:hypothetical protein
VPFVVAPSADDQVPALHDKHSAALEAAVVLLYEPGGQR